MHPFYQRPAGQLVSSVTGRSVGVPSSTVSTSPVVHQLNVNPNAPPAQDDTGLTVTASAPLWMWGAGGLLAAVILWKVLK